MVNRKLFKFLYSDLFMKKGVDIFVLVVVLAVLLLGAFVHAQEAGQVGQAGLSVSSDNGLWGIIKDNTVLVFSATSAFADKYVIGPIIGTRTFGGESIHIFSDYYWFEGFLHNAALSILVVLWTIPLVILYAVNDKSGGVTRFSSWRLHAAFFYFRYCKSALIFAVLYPLLMGVLVINRILQILTLEVLGVAVVWRAFIVSAVLIFGPLYFKKYIAYRVEIREYQEELQKVAGEEIIKAMAKG